MFDGFWILFLPNSADTPSHCQGFCLCEFNFVSYHEKLLRPSALRMPLGILMTTGLYRPYNLFSMDTIKPKRTIGEKP